MGSMLGSPVGEGGGDSVDSASIANRLEGFGGLLLQVLAKSKHESTLK